MPLLTRRSVAGANNVFSQCPHDAGNGVGTWTSVPFFLQNTGELFTSDKTIREIIHVSQGGESVRIVLTNELGSEVQRSRIGGATVAVTDGYGNLNPSETTNPTFAGTSEIAITPQSQVVSDPIQLRIEPNSNLAVSIFVPGQGIDTLTYQKFAMQNNFLAAGNHLTATTLPNPATVSEWCFLKGVEIQKENDAASIVCLGDSITDGFRSTMGAATEPQIRCPILPPLRSRSLVTSRSLRALISTKSFCMAPRSCRVRAPRSIPKPAKRFGKM
ncbi:hypothetical protein [Granulicella sibirica]|uniref:hypothetical protein n=1 Tax=Granulicella sibirica TaxID=2479048 RepID=UPI0010090C0C|nr:hypothetical protein [Granulicella sibirica]